MSFVERAITLTVTLGGGQNGDTVTGTYTLSDYRTECAIVINAGYAMGTCEARIYGLPLNLISQLTTIGPTNTVMMGKNVLTIEAGNKGSTLSTVFQGGIRYSFGQFQGAPDVCLSIQCWQALKEMRKNLPPISYKGPVDVAVILQNIANQVNFGFINNGVNVQLVNPYITGSAVQQIRAVVEAADIHFSTDRNILSIWPKNGSRGAVIPVITPSTGLVGYAGFSSQGLSVQTEFMPTILQGMQVNIQDSQLSLVNGIWLVSSLEHNISSQVPNGPWFTYLNLTKLAPPQTKNG